MPGEGNSLLSDQVAPQGVSAAEPGALFSCAEILQKGSSQSLTRDFTTRSRVRFAPSHPFGMRWRVRVEAAHA